MVSTPAAQHAMDPYAIFARARHAWILQAYPRSVSYTIEVSGMEGHALVVRRYVVNDDTRSGQAFPNPVSLEQQEHPFVSRGTNFNVQFGPIPVTLNPEHANEDPFGIPALVPNYSFGLAPVVMTSASSQADVIAAVRAQFPSRQEPISPGELPQIGSVTAAHHDYLIELAGEEPVAGAPAYHLKLHPLREPKRYRLRDVWIDQASYALDKLVSSGNFERGPATRSEWTVDYQTIGGLEFIADERAGGTLRYADDPLGITGHLVGEETFVFKDVQMSQRGFVETRPVNPGLEIVREPD